MRIVWQSAPAAHDRAVVLCCDAKYLPFSLMAAGQVLAQPEARDFDVCIVANEPVSLPPTLAHLPVRLVQVDPGLLFDDQDVHGRLPVASYVRLALPDILAGDYGRIAYLDSDMFIDGGDFGRLLRLDLGGRPLAAVRDYYQWLNPEVHIGDFKAAGLPARPYFNSGLLLFDLDDWRRRQVMARCLEIGRRYGPALKNYDQSLLNCLFPGDWAELSPVWNWQISFKRPFLETVAGPNVVHFIGPWKAWNDGDTHHLPIRYRRAYARYMAAHFPGRDLVPPVTRNRLRERKLLQLQWFRQATATPAMLRYLDRFADDFDVKR
jgi:lipopolysaccharide biosynthesis glycosyltransferase